jgi:hypothetical protein
VSNIVLGLVIVGSVDMSGYTIEQRVSLFESYVKCGSARKCRTKFRSKIPGITVRSTTGIHKHINKVNRSSESLIDKKPAKSRVNT